MGCKKLGGNRVWGAEQKQEGIRGLGVAKALRERGR